MVRITVIIRTTSHGPLDGCVMSQALRKRVS